MTEWCRAGRYSDEGGLGLALLFEDLGLMARNAKQFNSANVFFLPWRLCDVFEKTAQTIKRLLVHTHKKLRLVLDCPADSDRAVPTPCSSHQTPAKPRVKGGGKAQKAAQGLVSPPAVETSAACRPLAKKPFCLAASKPAGSTGPTLNSQSKVIATSPGGDADSDSVASPATLQINYELGLESSQSGAAAKALPGASVMLGSQFSQSQSQSYSQAMVI
jgi:hypothetical protein